MALNLVIHQPNFFPYIGFFEQLQMADLYIAFDNVQFVENEFQNRNFILCKDQGRINLTLPVLKKGRFGQNIMDVELADSGWLKKILSRIQACYSRAPYYKEVMNDLNCAVPTHARFMVDVNLALIELFCMKMNINIEILRSSSIPIAYEDRQDRLIKLMKAVGATKLIFGIGADQYLDKEIFATNGLEYQVHEFFPKKYSQLQSNFVPYLSILDYVMNMGWSLNCR